MGAGLDVDDGVLAYATDLVLDVGTYVGLASLRSAPFPAPLPSDRPGPYRLRSDATPTFAPERRFVRNLRSVPFAPVVTRSELTGGTPGEALAVAAFGLVVLVVPSHVPNATARGLGLLTARVLRHARSPDG